jgi:hypothetical protein
VRLSKVDQEWPPDQENDYVKTATSLKWVIDFQLIVLCLIICTYSKAGKYRMVGWGRVKGDVWFYAAF